MLFVVDATRRWYDGGDDAHQYWSSRLTAAVAGYSSVLMIGDSMGATAALLFSRLATAVVAFTPQIDLTRSSIRPGESTGWRDALRLKLFESVKASDADIQVGLRPCSNAPAHAPFVSAHGGVRTAPSRCTRACAVGVMWYSSVLSGQQHARRCGGRARRAHAVTPQTARSPSLLLLEPPFPPLCAAAGTATMRTADS